MAATVIRGAFDRLLDMTEKVEIGIVGEMPDIIEAQIKAEKVITV